MRRLSTITAWLGVMVILGTVGYWWIEQWDLADSLYMTLITISTVGYGETRPLSGTGRIWTGGLIFVSLISMTAWTAMVTSFIVESDLSGSFQRQRTRRMISRMNGHTIVCGVGLIGRLVIDQLHRQNIDLVAIAEDENTLNGLKSRYRNLQTLCGSPVDELVLAKANILMAQNVIAATDSDMSNLLIGITCRDIDDQLNVIAEASDPGIANRMRKSGINTVVSPMELGSREIAGAVVNASS